MQLYQNTTQLFYSFFFIEYKARSLTNNIKHLFSVQASFLTKQGILVQFSLSLNAFNLGILLPRLAAFLYKKFAF